MTSVRGTQAGEARRARRRSTRGPPARSPAHAARCGRRPPTALRAARGTGRCGSTPRASSRSADATIAGTDRPSGRQRVDHAQLEPAARSDRREERGQVVREVVLGRQTELVAVRDPVGERQRFADRDEVVVRRSDAHHRRPQRVVGPRRIRGSFRARRARMRPRSIASHTANRVDAHPDGARATKGEFANVAASSGPSACAVRQRLGARVFGRRDRR